MRKDRLIALINHVCSDERTRYKDFAELTGISRNTIRAVCDGRQRVNEDLEDRICELYPQYKMWFVFGEVYPEIGQISPDLEDTRKAYNG